METKRSAYDVITDRMIEQLAKGVPPWRKPWIASGEPANLISQKEYRGINWLLLSCAKYQSRYWLTFNQAKDLGAFVKKGEHGFPVVFYKEYEKEKEGATPDEAKDSVFVLRYYTVFNLDQIDGLPEKTLAKIKAAETSGVPFEPLTACEEIVESYQDKPEVSYGGGRAFYRPANDTIGMPPKDTFASVPAFYSTLFHELAHSTGAQKRLGRFDPSDDAHFGSASYSREELVAEMTAAFLCGKAHIETATLENSAAYCQAWIKRLKGDAKLVVHAAGAAQKAADYILGKHRTGAVLPPPPSTPTTAEPEPATIPSPEPETVKIPVVTFTSGKCLYVIHEKKASAFLPPLETNKSIAAFHAGLARRALYAPNTWKEASRRCPRCCSEPNTATLHTIGATYKVCHDCQKISVND